MGNAVENSPADEPTNKDDLDQQNSPDQSVSHQSVSDQLTNSSFSNQLAGDFRGAYLSHSVDMEQSRTGRSRRNEKRFKQIVKGKIRKNLRKYVKNGEMIGKKGKEIVSIPVPDIDIPRFKHGRRGSGGVGQGEGEIGKSIGKDGDPQDGQGQAGNDPGNHIREVDIELDELAQIMGEEMKLPRIKPKGEGELKQASKKWNTRGPIGVIKDMRKTYKNALKRSAMEDPSFVPGASIPIITKQDEEFKKETIEYKPEAKAGIIYIMDVSGSMTDDQKDIVRTEAFWIDTWLDSQYEGLAKRYIVHDAVAHSVDQDTFYRVRESGGTRISSAYKEVLKVIRTDSKFNPANTNIYIFQFSDGDNWGEDNAGCLGVLKEVMEYVNLFGYGQVDSPYGSGDFIKELRKLDDDFEELVLSEIPDKDAIYDSIKKFLSTGK